MGIHGRRDLKTLAEDNYQRDTVHSPTITTMPFSANRAVRVMGRSTQGSFPCVTRGKWRYGNKRR